MTPDPVGTASATPRSRTCRSHRRYGRCGLPAKHAGDHAVPIDDGMWFGYTRDGDPVGYYEREEEAQHV